MKTVRTIMPQVTGLGDIVAKVAKPVAKAIDKVAGTNLQNCGSCAKRQQTLNQKFPMKTSLIAILLAFPIMARALDYTYSTNLFYAIDTITNVYCGTNAADATRDSFITAWNKLNDNDNWLARQNLARSNQASDVYLAFTNYAATNLALVVNPASPRAPAAVTVGGSPFNYTNQTGGYLECYFSGGTAYSVSKNGAAVYGSLIGNGYFLLAPTNYCAITYTVAPTLYTNKF